MKKGHVAIIDCSIKTIANHYFNHLVEKLDLSITYHLPAIYGMNSLNELKNIRAIIVGGSFSNITDRENWHKNLLSFLKEKIEKDRILTIGICFGHQLLVDGYGGHVDYIKNKNTKYREVREITFLKNINNIKNGDKLKFALSHSQEVKSITDNMIHVATSNRCQYEGVSHKNFPWISFQCHPEITNLFFDELTVVASENDKLESVVNGIRLMRNLLT